MSENEGQLPADGAIAAFGDHAAEYEDVLRHRLIPCFEAFYGAAVDVLDLRQGPVDRVLDLGAGTGLLTSRIASRYPDAHFVLVDGAEEMLHKASQRLSSAQIEVVQQDLREELPDGPFDAVVSALAIHHLSDEAKQDLFARAQSQLRPGGVFVNAEQVAGPTPWLDTLYHTTWRRKSQAAGATEQELTDAEERMTHDRCAPLQPQLEWLQEAGFVDVDCFFKDGLFAVFAGWRPEAAE